MLATDLTYVPKGRIRPTYLLDAAMETGWITAWAARGPVRSLWRSRDAVPSRCRACITSNSCPAIPAPAVPPTEARR
ncbi:hypothetical protein EEJ42_09445 [Streptomyces botrytidirepellens]|uniref:Uncharacterized protein n=1 Tax=Streptomyces botrytidirepellens TaxID=2486417 RepID=A0A3M8WKQ2_9ACTN|nr:hypothetical protein EEJ42_09445 [Streptomyces botrytidirepellens]